MGKFRKKPVVIEAIRFQGRESYDEMGKAWGVVEFVGGTSYFEDTNDLKIFTLEGDLKANLGDWIIKGVKGEFYPCKPDIFAATYEAVE